MSQISVTLTIDGPDNGEPTDVDLESLMLGVIGALTRDVTFGVSYQGTLIGVVAEAPGFDQMRTAVRLR